jgi:pimeloyl-ACP methyl ester carboxylesterase
MRRGYVDLAEGQMHYQTGGSGPDLLLLHQSPLSSAEYVAMLPRLAEETRVFAIDYLGHGNSDDPIRELEMVDYARHAVEFMDALGIQRANLCGHHTGAMVAVAIAATYPERVEKAILSGCPVYTREEWESFLSQPMSRDFPITENGDFLQKAWERYQSLAPHVGPEYWFKPFIIALASRHRPYDAHLAAARYDIKPDLQKMFCPTLLVSGSQDMFLDQLQQTSQLMPNCITGVIDDGGLFINFEKPHEFADMILDFITGRKS